MPPANPPTSSSRVIRIKISREQYTDAKRAAGKRSVEDWAYDLINRALEANARWTEPGRADCSHTRTRPDGKLPGVFVCLDCGAVGLTTKGPKQ